MANWIQAWYDTETGNYHVGSQPPSGNQQPQQQGQQVRVGYNQQQQFSYVQPQPQSSYYAPGGTPTNVAVGSQFASPGSKIGVRYNYNPQSVYRPVYNQQPYATRAPYAPNQPYYETVIGSDGQPRVIRLGEYQQMQPTHYETFYNSQGQLVQVPQYAPMNNSAAAVGTTDQIIGGSNQPVVATTTPATTPATTLATTPATTPATTTIKKDETTIPTTDQTKRLPENLKINDFNMAPMRMTLNGAIEKAANEGISENEFVSALQDIEDEEDLRVQELTNVMGVTREDLQSQRMSDDTKYNLAIEKAKNRKFAQQIAEQISQTPITGF